MRMLMVDASPLVRAFMKRALHSCWPEAEILEASDGDQALNLARQQSPDVVLLDLELRSPGGLGFLERLRASEAGRQMPVLMFSALWSSWDRAALAVDPWTLCLDKPPALAQIRAALDSLLTSAAG